MPNNIISKLIETPFFKQTGIWLFLLLAIPSNQLYGQVGFMVDDVVLNLTSPTSLEFGPDGRLYVSQQNGTLTVYAISRVGNGSYQVDSFETILDVKDDVPNHDDDGVFDATQKRQITGLMTAGTALNPVLYVSSSDWRIKVGVGGNLDTNSGTISRLTWVGTGIGDPAGFWDKVDLVRGLPRSEENHATNGMDLDETTNTLYVMNGGNCNKGVPSNNFGGIAEYALSAALLSIDLDAINSMPVYVDSRTNTKFVYDLPTLDDPSRTNIGNSHPDFPYPANHPSFNDSIDLGDPFGGNNGLNQALWVVNGPVQVYSPGYRNAYDVVLTAAGRLYTFDNGPNGGWGGLPLVYDALGTSKGTGPWAPGDYTTNELQESSSAGHGDGLHFINGPGYYGGYPNPTRANPDKANLYYYLNDGSGWVVDSVYDFMTDFPAPPVPLSLANPIEGDYQAPTTAMMVINSSTNGLTEYTASNFGGVMQGDLLAVAFNDNVYHIEINAAGDAVVNSTALLNGFGSNPLDVTTQGDNEVFPGTIWVALHGDDKITVFEPNDFAPFSCDSIYSTLIDSDGDGYTNADELDNGTDPCSQGSKPKDYDSDFISNLNDDDDDNDGLLDTYDPFAVDPNNGLSTQLPIIYDFSINGNDAVSGSLFGLGFTGLLTNGDPINLIAGSTYQSLYEEDSLNLGGATSKFGIENIGAGDALAGLNSQQNGFQFGLNIDTSTASFTILTRVESPYFLIDGIPTTPLAGQSLGLITGPGNQDNYLKIVMNSQGGSAGIGVVMEVDGVVTHSTDYPAAVVGNLLSSTAIDFYLALDPIARSIQPKISIDGGINIISLGSSLIVPTAWFDLSDGMGWAVGIISTSGASGQKYDATWDYIRVLFQRPNALGIPDQVGLNGQPTDSLNLHTYFDDDEGDANLSYTLLSNTAILATTQITGNQLFISYPATGTGVDTVVVQATDSDGNFILDTVRIVVIEPTTTYYRVNAGGILLSALDAPNQDWEEDTQANPASYHNTGNKTNGYAITNTDASVPGTTPLSIFQSGRWDMTAAPEMEWDFPVPANGDYEIRLYFVDGFSGTSNPGNRDFSVEIEGIMVLPNYDIVADVGHMIGTMKSFTHTVTDGNIDINFFLGSKGTPLVNGIEIRGASSTGPSTKNLGISSASLHFFSTEVDSTSTPLNDTLFNTGNSPLTVTSATLTGTDASMFSFDQSPPFTIAGGNNLPFTVSFAPTAIGSKSASLEINHDGDNTSPLVIALTGEAISSVNQPPISNLGDRSDTINTVITIAGASYANDPEGDGLTFSSTGLTAIGLSINPANGNISGTLTNAPGNYSVSIKIVDNGSPADSTLETLTWSITTQAVLGLWQQEASSDGSLLVERNENDYVEANGKFYLLGGRGAVGVSIYDPVLKTWSTGTPPPFQLHHFQGITYNNKIYILGAMTGSYPNESPVDSIYVYDPALDSWDAVEEIPAGRRRGSGGTILYNNEFYWISGLTNGHISGHVTWADKYNPVTGVWTVLADAPRARDHFRAIETAGKIFLAGGRLSMANNGSVYANTVAEVDVYDIGTNTWSTFSEPIPTKRAGTMSVLYQGRVMVLGGESDQQVIAHNEAEGLDPATGTWASFPPLLSGRQATGAVLFNNRIYVAGGVGNRGGNPKLTTQEYYSLGNNPVFPVRFLSFEATPNSDKAVELSWTIFLEGNTSGFVIEKSRDGSTFLKAGNLNIQQGLDGTIDFSFLDNTPYKGISYYRIQEIGADGSFHYSSTAAVRISEEGILIYPTPVGESRQLFVDGLLPEGARLTIQDLRGREALSIGLDRSNHPTTYPVDLHSLPAGMYSVSIVLQNRVVTQKIIIP